MSDADRYSDDKGVLKNNLGIKDQKTLDQFESNVTTIRAAELRENPIQGKFDLDHLKAIHTHLFKDVYPWAGEIRDVRISKGPTEFAHPDYIRPEATKLLARLNAENNLKGLDRDAFADRAAHYMTEINALHPFREGNGRTQQVFIEQLAKSAGHELSFAQVTRDQLNHASLMAHHQGHQHLTGVIKEAMQSQQREHVQEQQRGM